MSLLYLVRHAATEPQPGVEPTLWNLSEAGFVAAAALAGRRFWPEVQRVVTSTERKAIATAAPAAEMWRLPLESQAAFNEVRRGGWSEEYEADVAAFFARPDDPPQGWESAASAQQRTVEGLEAVARTFPGQNLALVGHGLLWSLLRAHLLGQAQVNARAWRAIRMPDVAVWQREANGWLLRQDFEGIRNFSNQ
jgi:broad specificity phosphatase PhoE